MKATRRVSELFCITGLRLFTFYATMLAEQNSSACLIAVFLSAITSDLMHGALFKYDGRSLLRGGL